MTHYGPYFYGPEADMFTFYQVPKVLLDGEEYKTLSAESILLYSIMLDRMKLSTMTGRKDREGRVYIYLKQSEAMQKLHVNTGKIAQIFRELEAADLIERKRQGQGKPTMIYIKKFTKVNIPPQKCENRISGNADAPQKCENRISGNAEIASPEMRKPHLPYLNKIKKSEISIDQSATLSAVAPPETLPETLPEDDRENLRIQIEADRLIAERPEDTTQITAIVELITDVCSSQTPTIHVNHEVRPRSEVLRRFQMLTSDMITAILDGMPDRQQIRNPRNYLLTALYNAPATTISNSSGEPQTIPKSELRKYAQELLKT